MGSRIFKRTNSPAWGATNNNSMKALTIIIYVVAFVTVATVAVAVKNSWSDIKRYVKTYFKTLRVKREARKIQQINNYLLNRYISPKV